MAEAVARLLDVARVAVLEFVARRPLVRVAHLPEPLDERVALVVLLELDEGLQLLVGDDRVHLFEPLPVFLRQLLGRGTELLALGAADLVLVLGLDHGRADQSKGAQGEEGEESREEGPEWKYRHRMLPGAGWRNGSPGLIQHPCRGW
jgi:hypothetical protein